MEREDRDRVCPLHVRRRQGRVMALYAFEGFRPNVASDAYVHPQAVLIGAVTIGSRCFIGAGAVIRADFADIQVGDGTCIQENCVIHVSPGQGACLHERVIVGHGAVLHDVTIQAGAFVGMGAVLLQGVLLEKEAMVAAGSVVPSGFVVPAGKLASGNPAKVLKDLSDSYREFIRMGQTLYEDLSGRYRIGLRRID